MATFVTSADSVRVIWNMASVWYMTTAQTTSPHQKSPTSTNLPDYQITKLPIYQVTNLLIYQLTNLPTYTLKGDSMTTQNKTAVVAVGGNALILEN